MLLVKKVLTKDIMVYLDTFIPKGTNIDDYSYEYINSSVNWMNNYPRKILDYKTPIEALKEEIKDDKILKKILNIQKMVNA